MTHDVVVDYDRLLPTEFDDRVREAPVVYQPVGCMEWHAKHLPLGLDGLKAHEICRAAAREAGGIVMPPSHLGVHPAFEMQPYHRTHNLYISEDLFERWVRESVEQLQAVGFQVVALVTGHFPSFQGKLLRRLAGEITCQKHGRVAVIAPDEDEAAEAVLGRGVDHAGTWETSLMMHLHPELVRMQRLDVLDGIHGEDPRGTASPEIGRAGCEAFVKVVVDAVRAALASGS